MLRKRFSKDEFEKIFQLFNEAVYRREMEKLNYKSWKNIKNWLLDEKWQQMEVSKEWVRIRDGDNDTNPYAYHDEERIFVGPYDDTYFCPNPEELDPDDNSFGTWLNDLCAYASTVEFRNIYEPKSYSLEINADGLKLKDNSQSQIEKSYENKEENNKMMKFDFGPVDSSVHMSMYGMAIKNASGTYVAYDANSKQIMDVDILNFEGANKFIYKMPATLSQIAAGDVVIHARKPMFVQEVRKDNRLSVMDIFDGEEKTIVPAKSPFGFDFVTKVVSLFDFNSSADASNPFGNMLPFLMLSDSNRTDTENLLPLMLMAGGNMDMSNPMMLWALMGNRTNDPIMLAMAMGAFKQPTHNCTCGDNCSCKENK